MVKKLMQRGWLPVHKQLWKAAADGNSAEVQRLLTSAGAQPNHADELGHAALHKAALEGHTQVVGILLDAGANPEARTNPVNRERTPLYLAVMEGHKEAAELLLQHGANPNATDRDGFSVLHVAADKAAVELIGLLCSYGALLDANNTREGWTPLHLAAFKGHERAVQKLVQLGANTAAQDMQQRTPADIACGDRQARPFLRPHILRQLEQPPTPSSATASPSTAPTPDGTQPFTPLASPHHRSSRPSSSSLSAASSVPTPHHLPTSWHGTPPASTQVLHLQHVHPHNGVVWDTNPPRDQMSVASGSQYEGFGPSHTLHHSVSSTTPISGTQQAVYSLRSSGSSPAASLLSAQPSTELPPSQQFRHPQHLQSSIPHPQAMSGTPFPQALSGSPYPQALSGSPYPQAVDQLSQLSLSEQSSAQGFFGAPSLHQHTLQGSTDPATYPAPDPASQQSDSSSTHSSSRPPKRSNWHSAPSTPQPLRSPAMSGRFLTGDNSIRAAQVLAPVDQMSEPSSLSTVPAGSQQLQAVALASPEGSTNPAIAEAAADSLSTHSLADQRSPFEQSPHPRGLMPTTAATAAGGVGMAAAVGIGSLVNPGIQAAVQHGAAAVVKLTGAVLLSQPFSAIEGICSLAKLLGECCEDAAYCRYKIGRIRARVDALLPSLETLKSHLESEAANLDARVVDGIAGTLDALEKVINDAWEVVQKLSRSKPNLLGRTVQFLKGVGYRDHFETLDTELLGCITQLSLLLQMLAIPLDNTQTQLTEDWARQNVEDWSRDLRELESLMLLELRGVGEHVDEAMEQLQAMFEEQNEDVCELLQQIYESQGYITGRLSQIDSKIDDVKAMAELVLQYVRSPPRERQSPPPFVIPWSHIEFTDDQEGQREREGGYGKVLKARRDKFGDVAIKIFHIMATGASDLKECLTESLHLSRVNHHNVVRCYGILVDEVDSSRDSKNGSLVMEWIEGRNVYQWLQEELQRQRDVSVATRVAVALQVAAGMRHMHKQRVVHGDIKPQNVMVALGGWKRDEAVAPLVKICDFGLAKHNSTSTLSSTNGTTSTIVKRCSELYCSPQRLKNYRRTKADDVYGFGMLMYFIATSKEPFHYMEAGKFRDAVAVRGERPTEYLEAWVQRQQGGDWEWQAIRFAELAMECWHQDPKQRPEGGFDEIYNRLRDMLWHGR